MLVEVELYDSLLPTRALLHKGDIVVDFLLSALLGCSRSGDRARRSSGEPKVFGSADLGREKDFLLGVRLWTLPGENDCVALEAPGWWPMGTASGLGDRVGETGSGEGDGVRANGDSGM